MEPTRYTVTFEVRQPDPLGRQPITRIKQLLKLAGRAFNLRCVSCRQGEDPSNGAASLSPHEHGDHHDECRQGPVAQDSQTDEYDAEDRKHGPAVKHEIMIPMRVEKPDLRTHRPNTKAAKSPVTATPAGKTSGNTAKVSTIVSACGSEDGDSRNYQTGCQGFEGATDGYDETRNT